MPTQYLYIVTGLPYAGKTTLTRQLVDRFRFSTASVDEVLDQIPIPVEDMTQHDWNQVYSEAYSRLKEKLARKETVVFDGGSLKKSERETLRQIAESFGAVPVLIYVKASPELIRDRWRVNQTTRQRDHLEETTLIRAMAMFQEPGLSEKPLIYLSGTDPGKWVGENIYDRT